MKGILVAASIALIVSLFGTPLAIRFFRSRGYGQLIRDDGPTTHHTKRGTPTMGGTVILAAAILGYLAANGSVGSGPTASGVLVLALATGLGLVGFLDDMIKIRMQRNLGLRARTKLAGQIIVAVVFGILAVQFPNHAGLRPASTHVSFVRDTTVTLGTIGFVIWALILVASTSNGVNLTDGLDGLATGTATMVFAAFVIITFWQARNACLTKMAPGCYEVRDPFDLAIVAAAFAGACAGFLWWNAAPARIFMGDTGSLALGGGLAGLAVMAHTELLLAILGGLFVLITMSSIVQIASFKLTRRRVFKMAPLQHHFELKGWAEVTIVIRFWIIAGLAVALGLGVFYGEWITWQG
ncbi:MAG: phospho-N-acetylmuramoyl-pentapeptide-transferase [Acidothermus sp.]|nr:phospho-N-acetylmuramoyl-pentapeptide-transferase [Acidothermus sp.]